METLKRKELLDSSPPDPTSFRQTKESVKCRSRSLCKVYHMSILRHVTIRSETTKVTGACKYNVKVMPGTIKLRSIMENADMFLSVHP